MRHAAAVGNPLAFSEFILMYDDVRQAGYAIDAAVLISTKDTWDAAPARLGKVGSRKY